MFKRNFGSALTILCGVAMLLCGARIGYAQTTQTRGPGGEFSGTVLFLTMGDVNACESQINALTAYYTHFLQFIPTGYCIKDENYQCGNDAALKQRWQDGLTACFKKAVSFGFTRISIIVHADYAPSYVWRNQLFFDPTVVYNGSSYNTTALLPAATALKTAMAGRSNMLGYFALAGEMGSSTFKYPLSWLALYTSYKQFFANCSILVGTELNYQKVCNCVNVHVNDPFTYAAEYNKSAAAAIAASGFSEANVTKFLYATDFLSVSIYHPVPSAAMGLADFDRGMGWFSDELASFNFSLDKYNKLKPLLIGETGFGGANSDGVTVAPNYQYALRHPFFGTWYPAGSNNPWLNKTYSAIRLKWYQTLFLWLRSPKTMRFYVTADFNYCAGSWDFMSVQPESMGYANTTIANFAKQHNLLLQGKPSGK